MFLINQLNRRITDQYYPAFECFYSAEAFLINLQLFTSIPLINAIWRSQLHKNLRLRLISCIFYTCLSSLVRLYVMCYQIYGATEKVITIPLIVCSLIRKALFAFFGSLPFYIAMDRFVASRHWNWYDKGGNMTTVFFAALEMIHLSLSFLDSYLLIYDYVTDLYYMVECGVFILIASTFYYFVYRTDKQEMERILKRGPTINSYSITRSYQLKENINLMNMFSRMSFPIGISISPQFVAFGLISFVSPGKFDYIRYFAIAFFDLWIVVNGIVAFVSIPFSQPQIARHMPTRLQFSIDKISIEKSDINADTTTYFDQFSRRWHSNNRVNPVDP